MIWKNLKEKLVLRKKFKLDLFCQEVATEDLSIPLESKYRVGRWMSRHEVLSESAFCWCSECGFEIQPTVTKWWKGDKQFSILELPHKCPRCKRDMEKEHVYNRIYPPTPCYPACRACMKGQ